MSRDGGRVGVAVMIDQRAYARGNASAIGSFFCRLHGVFYKEERDGRDSPSVLLARIVTDARAPCDYLDVMTKNGSVANSRSFATLRMTASGMSECDADHISRLATHEMATTRSKRRSAVMRPENHQMQHARIAPT